jgi:predicted lactoylglutathione lyase
MDPRVSFITLAVADLEATRAFYVDGLGWPAELDVPGEVLMIKVGEQLILSLWAEADFEAEIGPIRRGPGLAPVALAHNQATRAGVDEVLEAARAAGSTDVRVGQHREWGGYSGHFSDPDGFYWEVAWNPGPVGLIAVPDTDPTG